MVEGAAKATPNPNEKIKDITKRILLTCEVSKGWNKFIMERLPRRFLNSYIPRTKNLLAAANDATQRSRFLAIEIISGYFQIGSLLSSRLRDSKQRNG
jgi:hypothetical protein